MSKQRSQKFKVDISSVAEEPSLTTSVDEGTDPETLPFIEFSDQDLNAEKWDISALGKDKSISTQAEVFFEDPHKIHLPSGYTVYEWKRCSEIYPNCNFVVFSHISKYPDLISPNQHLLKSEFYRNFISSIETLLYIGCMKPFPQEYENPAFCSVGSRQWRPWFHIYSQCKITKGEHLPAFNPSGKYVVRLYWLGTWRKIYVDDMVPIDIYNNVLLPSLYIPKTSMHDSLENIDVEKHSKTKSKGGSPVKKEVIELWPIILSKALLKIRSLHLYKSNQFSDFDIINCLTGWVPQRINTKKISASDLWDIFMAYVERFEWADYKEESTKRTGSTKTKSKGKDIPDTPKKAAKGVIPTGIENMRDGDRFVVLSCNSFEHGSLNGSDTLEDRHIEMFLSQVRDIPIIRPPPRPELEFWKTFRYEQWAVEQGIIPPDIKKLNIQSLKIVDPFKRLLKNDQFYNQIISDVTQDLDNTDKKSEKSSKSSKKTDKSAKGVQLEPDPSMWIEFSNIQETASYLTIYFQPRVFKCKIMVSDINFANKPAGFHPVISSYILKEIRNEPIYMFIDSIDFKFLAINLAQVGDISMLQKASEDEEIKEEERPEDLDICDEIIRKKTKKDASESELDIDSKLSVCDIKSHPVSLVLEEYCWESNTLGQPKGMINTFGTKSLIIDLKPGRASFRLWLSCHCSYVLQVFSDTAITVGCLEEYLLACSMESQLLTNLCFELSSGYGRLVQSFGMPEYSVSLRNFYQCYKPFQHLSKRELAIVHKIFFEELCKIVTENSSLPDAVQSVKLLFLQLKTFDYINPYIEEPHLYPDKFPLDEQVEYAKLMQRSAVKVQAFFKRIYIRSLMKKMHEDHKQYYSIFDTLKKIYIDLFSADKRLNNCPTLLRRFFERKGMKDLVNKFDLYNDIQSVLNLYVYNGTLTVPELSWVPLCRYEFHINSNEPMLIKINMFCNLKTYFLRIFDNDSLREIKRMNSDVIVEQYSKNNNGYTVLAYGWSDEHTKVNWKLILALRKMSRNDLLIIPNTLMATACLRDHYIPNFDNVICRYIIKVGSNSFLTANLTTSYDQVRVSLKLLNKDGKVLRDACGIKSVIFPLLDLRFDELDSLISLQGYKKKISTASGLSDITYSKLHKKHVSGDARGSSVSKRSSIDGEEPDSGHKRHKKRMSTASDNLDGADELNNTAFRNEADTMGKISAGKNISLSKGLRLSFPSKVRNSSRGAPNNLSKFTENVHTEYILEAKVIGNSWPLTAEEWNRVQKIRERSYLNLIDDGRMAVKKSSVPKKSLTLDEPYWILDLVYVSGNSVEFEENRSKSEKRRESKMKWFADIERYKKAVELRRAYVEQNSVPKTETATDRNARSNDPKDFATSVIAGEDLEKYMIKPLDEVDKDFCKTKREDDYIIDEANVEHQIKEYEEDEKAIREEIESQLQEQKENFNVISRWFEDIRSDSLEMLTEASAMEKEYIKKVLQASSKSKSGNKDKGKRKK